VSEIPATEAKVTVLCCGIAGVRSTILKSLYRRVSSYGPTITDSGADTPGRGGLSRMAVAYLPLPGAEVFSGTTVGEELAFGADSRLLTSDDLFSGEARLLRRLFEPIVQRSVWELSSAERRLLLLASQVALNPGLWLCDEPLACLDGSMRRRVLDFLSGCSRSGAAVLSASAEPAALASIADNYVVLDDEGCVDMVLAGNGMPADDAGKTKRPASLWFTGIDGNHKSEVRGGID
jgi:ABC-2 type transport system ATP-binding protein